MTNRQELVNKLRYLAQGCDYKDVDKETAFDALERTVGTQNESCVYPTFKRLADLIDSTCHMRETVEDERTVYVCSNCGSWKSEDKKILSLFNYCPVCGARVVRDDLQNETPSKA